MIENPFLRRILQRPWGRSAEAQLAKRLGGRQVPGSGNQDHSKGDVVTSGSAISGAGFVVEGKSTIHGSLYIQLDWLTKVTREALATSKRPALSVAFVTRDGRPKVNGKWMMIPEDVFIDLVNPYRTPGAPPGDGCP